MKNSGILLVNKERGCTSFDIVDLLRKRTQIKKIGHAGTLDPFATGVMVMLVGSEYTKQSNRFLNHDKQYIATLCLGISTDTYDLDGELTHRNEFVPSLEQVETALKTFQGEILQVPPMFSAKKVRGKKLYELARQGITIAREPVQVRLSIQLISYAYPELEILIDCSKGTYIRSLAHDLGELLQTGAHLSSLTRTKSGSFTIEQCVAQSDLKNPSFNITEFFHV